MNQGEKSRVPMYAFVFFAFLASAIPGEAHPQLDWHGAVLRRV